MTKIIQPTYVTTQPSTGKKIQYRPYTIKEEKALLYALQDGSLDAIVAAIKNTVNACTEGALDPSIAPYYDAEYVFLQIRSKSVGEVVDLKGGCDEGKPGETDFTVDIQDIVIEPKPESHIVIKIPQSNYTVKFRHPTIDEFASIYESGGENASDVIASCLVSVYTDDESFDWSTQEKIDFVDSMNPIQQKQIAAWMANMPKIKLTGSYTCKGCGKLHTKTVSGFQNFFV